MPHSQSRTFLLTERTPISNFVSASPIVCSVLMSLHRRPTFTLPRCLQQSTTTFQIRRFVAVGEDGPVPVLGRYPQRMGDRLPMYIHSYSKPCMWVTPSPFRLQQRSWTWRSTDMYSSRPSQHMLMGQGSRPCSSTIKHYTNRRVWAWYELVWICKWWRRVLVGRSAFSSL